ncbi:hypothetical protein J2R99_002830 [Rhodopseudomonas julia]|uniref:Uncharacterized protein n=1 Tax=Rhodopseudomonas julia TaxID=200617 RepID=A0ABU0CAM2_9BRAD|nr:hypothetical protein [Rhodopseudomonas julia]
MGPCSAAVGRLKRRRTPPTRPVLWDGTCGDNEFYEMKKPRLKNPRVAPAGLLIRRPANDADTDEGRLTT